MTNRLSSHEWFRLVVAAIVLFVTLGMAIVGLLLCWEQITSNITQQPQVESTLKFGDQFEVSSGIVGVLVMGICLPFFLIANKSFHKQSEYDSIGIQNTSALIDH